MDFKDMVRIHARFEFRGQFTYLSPQNHFLVFFPRSRLCPGMHFRTSASSHPADFSNLKQCAAFPPKSCFFNTYPQSHIAPSAYRNLPGEVHHCEVKLLNILRHSIPLIMIWCKRPGCLISMFWAWSHYHKGTQYQVILLFKDVPQVLSQIIYPQGTSHILYISAVNVLPYPIAINHIICQECRPDPSVFIVEEMGVPAQFNRSLRS